MLTDHGNHMRELKRLAVQKQVQLPQTVNEKQLEEADKLSKLARNSTGNTRNTRSSEKTALADRPAGGDSVCDSLPADCTVMVCRDWGVLPIKLQQRGIKNLYACEVNCFVPP